MRPDRATFRQGPQCCITSSSASRGSDKRFGLVDAPTFFIVALVAHRGAARAHETMINPSDIPISSYGPEAILGFQQIGAAFRSYKGL
jgi:hypothetical protein